MDYNIVMENTTTVKKHGVYPGPNGRGYEWYSNGQYRGWALSKRDLNKMMKNPSVTLVYPDGSTRRVGGDWK